MVLREIDGAAIVDRARPIIRYEIDLDHVHAIGLAIANTAETATGVDTSRTVDTMIVVEEDGTTIVAIVEIDTNVLRVENETKCSTMIDGDEYKSPVSFALATEGTRADRR